MQFKLRAWDKHYNEMYHCDGFNLSEPSIYISHLPIHKIPKDIPTTVLTVTRDFHQFVIMEFINLYDVNNVPIYVDDIVEIEENGNKDLGVVLRHSNGAYVVNGLEQSEDRAFKIYYPYSKDIKLKVVDNVHEQKHLEKDKNYVY